MRSYEAARNLFTVLGFISWAVIIIGMLISLAGASAANSALGFPGGQRSSALAFAGMLPGLRVVLSGFLMLCAVQVARAGVDTAEYSQLLLKVAREQLEVSKQALNRGEKVVTGFAAITGDADAKRGDQTAESPGYAQHAVQAKKDGRDARTEPPLHKVNAHTVTKLNEEGTLLEYRGRQLTLENGKYMMNGIGFANLDRAKKYINQLVVPVK